MLGRITSLGIRHPRPTSLLVLLFVLAPAVIGGPAASKLNARNVFESAR